MYGKEFAYANTRIQGTVVRIRKDNEPVYVNLVHNTGVCLVTKVEDLDAHMESNGGQIKMHLDDLNLEPVPLGYVNNGGRAIYLQRIPLRRGPGNQGLTQGNCATTGERLWRFPNKSLRQCIIGKYPTFDKALEESKGTLKNNGKKFIAFDRNWAVTEGALFYKNELRVGDIIKGKPVLLKEYEYLKERLSEVLV